MDEDPVRSVMEVSRAKADVVDERQFRIVEPDVVDDIWNDELLHSRLVVEPSKVDRSGWRRVGRHLSASHYNTNITSIECHTSKNSR